MPLVPRPPSPPLDPVTLAYVAQVLTERLEAVEIYGEGGCPTCHDGELRGAIHTVQTLRAKVEKARKAG